MTTSTPKGSASTYRYPLSLFEGFGLEIEYMIVDRESLDVRPVADELFRRAAGGQSPSSFVPPDSDGLMGWTNELALHVLEFKTNRPTPTLEGMAQRFQEQVQAAEQLLEPLQCRLLPTGMHPWMNPDAETRLWPHECNEIYATYDRIFGCRGHGWGNLQSTHINLPFGDDEQFGRLHAAVRLVLPMLPALAASSPVVDGKWSPIADYRLEVYRTNSRRVPLMAGAVIPEPVFTRAEYERDILGRLYEALAPLDPEGILRHEWANARGCIARFDRGSIEIRVLDTQECPLADMAITALIVRLIEAMVQERWLTFEQQKAVHNEPLQRVFYDTTRYAERARISERALLASVGISRSLTWAGDVWMHLLDELVPDHPVWSPVLRQMLAAGTLSTRISRLIRRYPSRADLHAIYSELADCLRTGSLFGVD
ncbi:MAG: glutamate--cysteine ligase [Planctomycetota bacterium]|nr:MAG: glutamate--cysteine ligase [Planctomycetota bacterium]